jgi:hypothetical protein
MLSGLINTAERTMHDASLIQIDGGTQMRASLDAATVQEYQDAMQPAGWGDFPPVICYYDGAQYWLADGFHRVAAFRAAAATLDQPARIPADVRSGTRRDAILHAAGANASHGLRRATIDTLHWEAAPTERAANRADHLLAPENFDYYLRNVQKRLDFPVNQHAVTNAIMELAERIKIDATPAATSAAPWALPARYDGLYIRCLEFQGRWELSYPGTIPGFESVRFFESYNEMIAFLEQRRRDVVVAVDNRPLPAWVTAEPEAAPLTAADLTIMQPAPNLQSPISKSPNPPDPRIAHAQRLIDLYRQAIAASQEYGDLTGYYAETLAMERGAEKLISRLQRLVDTLTGKTVEAIEEEETAWG